MTAQCQDWLALFCTWNEHLLFNWLSSFLQFAGIANPSRQSYLRAAFIFTPSCFVAQCKDIHLFTERHTMPKLIDFVSLCHQICPLIICPFLQVKAQNKPTKQKKRLLRRFQKKIQMNILKSSVFHTPVFKAICNLVSQSLFWRAFYNRSQFLLFTYLAWRRHFAENSKIPSRGTKTK